MEAKLCDRCGNFFKLQQQEKSKLELKRIELKKINKIDCRSEKSLDLCPRCQEELQQWFDEKRLEQ